MSERSVVIVAPTIYPLGREGYGGVERLVALFLRGLLQHAGQWDLGCVCPEASTLPRRVKRISSGPPLHDYREPNLLPAVAPVLNVTSLFLDFSHSKPVGRSVWWLPHLSPIWHDSAIMQPPQPAKNVVALSEWQAERFRRIQKQDCRVLDPICGDGDYFVPDSLAPAGQADYLLFIGKLAPDKGCLEAIRSCRALKHRLEIVGPVTPGDPPDYVAEVLKQCDGQDIVYHGEVTEAHKLALLQGAKALLYPVSYPPGTGEAHSHKLVEGFLTGTPAIVYDQGCYTSDVRVMTPQGIKHYEDCKVGDLVWSLNTQTGMMETKQIEQVFEYDYNGTIVHFQNRRFDFRVTPNHRVLVRHWYPNPKKEEGWPPSKSCYEYRAAISLLSPGGHKSLPLSSTWEGEELTIAVPDIPYPNMNKLPEVAVDDLLELWGWYISDGCVRRETRHKFARHVFISEPKGNQHRSQLEQLLLKMNLKYGTSDPHGILLQYYQLAELFSCAGNEARLKRIPSFLLAARPSHLVRLFNGLMYGDGHESKKAGTVYTTASPELAEDIAELCLKLGFECHLGSRLRKGHPINGRLLPDTTAFEVRVRKHIGVNGQLQRRHVTEEQYTGKVWCFKISDNNNMLVESNGDFVFCGNSMSEVIDQGVTGLVVSGRAELAEAIKTCETMDRARCRERAIERWDYRNVMARWLTVMAEVTRGARW